MDLKLLQKLWETQKIYLVPCGEGAASKCSAHSGNENTQHKRQPQVQRLLRVPWLVFSRISGLHPGRGISSVICGFLAHCGNSDEKEISGNYLHERNFIGHQVFMELLDACVFLTLSIERYSQGLSRVIVMVQHKIVVRYQQQYMVSDLRRDHVPKKDKDNDILLCFIVYSDFYVYYNI